MLEFEDQDTCRICSAPAEPDQPLFHPCKCSGTIRYIHQDCLTTWLAHSKKKSCDVCKHPYFFTKVYAPDMPPSLPPLLLVRRLIQHIILTLLFVARGIAVATIWLGVLPWVTVWTWRMYFSMGESTAWWISDRPRPPSADTPPFYNKIRYDAQVPLPKGLFARISSHPLWLALSADIFTGQIIASLIVLVFVAVFLLREWISQNARPGIFEEELPEDPAPVGPPQVPQVLQAGLVPAHPPARLEFPVPHERRLLPVLPRVDHPAPQPRDNPLHQQMDALLAMEAPNLQRHNFNPLDASDPNRWAAEDNRDVSNRRSKKKHKAKLSDDEDEEASRIQRKGGEDVKRKLFHRRIQVARRSAARHRVFTRRAVSSSPSPPSTRSASLLDRSPTTQSTFDFTFRAPFESNSPDAGPSSRLPSPSPSLPSLPISDLTASLPTLPSYNQSPDSPSHESHIPHSPFPSVALQPPSGSIPFSLRPALLPSPPVRPPLPTLALPRSGSASPFLSSGRTPLESPSRSTYRAPEELHTGMGAVSSSYFNADNGNNQEQEFEGEEANGKKRWIDDSVSIHSAETDSVFEMGNKDVQAEHDHYFALEDDAPRRDMGNDPMRPTSLDLMSESDSELSGEEEEEEGQGRGELADADDDDAQVGLVRFEVDREGARAVFEVQPVPGEDVRVGAVQADAPAEGQILVNQPAAEEPPANAEVNDEADANVEDDMEGAMEAIGMRGPIFGVFQNAALMIFVLDTAIGLCIWIPFTIGKTTALLSLDPHRTLQVLHFPIRAMRLVTDPFVDLIAYLLIDLYVPYIIGVFSIFFRISKFFVLVTVGKLIPSDTSRIASDLSWKVINQTSELVTRQFDYLIDLSTPTATTPSDPLSWSILNSIPDHLGPFEPYFVTLGSQVREIATSASTTWSSLALGTGPSNRAFAIILGYVVVTTFFCIYLNVLTVGNAKTAGATLRNVIKQQLLVLKVAAFIFIELVTFPLGCGIVLDLCTVWLFPEANLHSRIAFFWQAPLTAMFYHWVAGTMFMYTFAVLLSGCRSIMRPGAMWFIKDPQDQNSHPIRDILDRPTLVQLRKIFISGLMYSFVVACVVGSVAGLLLMGSKSIMPFRWKNREPLSNVPVDLLFLHLVLPYTVHYFRPKKAIKEVAMVVWKFLATRLRLTSYFFGDRHPREEFTPKDWRDNFIQSGTFVANPDVPPDGSFRRVPATDNLALPRDMRATVAVTADGEPVDEAARALMVLQNAEVEKAKHNIQEDYTIVYIPPNFRWRVITFIAVLWIIGAICVGFVVALPLSLGRSFFRLFTPRDVHDGYSFIVGFYLIWLCYLIARSIDRLDRRRKRRSGSEGPRAELGLLVVKRGLLWFAKMIYMALFLGIAIPILLAVVIDLYVVLPIRFSVNPAMVPRIRIVDEWALGLLYAKIAIYAQRIQPPSRISRGLQQILALGWTRPDPVLATKEVIAPLVGGLVGMIIIPGAVFKVATYYFSNLVQDNRFIFMHVYPSVFVFASTIHSALKLCNALSAWSLAIRDKEFLVEMRLRNHNPEKASEKGNGGGDVQELEQHDDVVAAAPLPEEANGLDEVALEFE